MIATLATSFLTSALLLQQSAGGAAAGAQRAPSLTANPIGVHSLQGYSVVLVVGDMQTAGGADTVPAAARKALTDMQAFLPYKRYQLLDAAWMTCCAAYRTPMVGRLRGPDDREYSYSIDTLGAESGKLTIRFWLREGDAAVAASGGGGARGSGSSASSGGGFGGTVVGPQTGLSDTARAEYSRQLYEARKERDDAEIQLKQAQRRQDVGNASPSEMELASSRFQLAKGRVEELERVLGSRNSASYSSSWSTSRGNLLDSTFSIAIGETVVIGTSRLKGDQALIALLTAAAKPNAAR